MAINNPSLMEGKKLTKTKIQTNKNAMKLLNNTSNYLNKKPQHTILKK